MRIAVAILCLWVAWCVPASAGEACVVPSGPDSYPKRIAALACNENALWFGAFIDADGRLASTTVAEAETARLRDGSTPAWRRVTDYWKGSGLLWQMSGFFGAAECGYSSAADPGQLRTADAACRAFVIDNPWSAVFVSYVMNRAGVPNFRASASHIDYVRDAYRSPDSPYLFADPDTTAPAVGDLLCFVRSSSAVYGYQGLKAFLDRDEGALNMHCDIAASIDGGRLYLIGGNVLQGVTLRELSLNRSGLLWALQRRGSVPADCRPGHEAGCSFSRQDWAVLLKLKPMAVSTPAPQLMPARDCCDVCPLPLPEGLRRCPAQHAPASPVPTPGS
ncbi:DUF2272 domain-containing protein [Lysobacter silvisoli]|uniref:DUF2272 domain-containing protein n=1 Tax=Lysobacter silvisoli TaxID=2293254 RepID=A0A371K3G8_9GAMM|nr:DUF2272 domain-containing protein [Lysobacter silvisoli]RDZ28476.1 DUF2272 domain-containing protein [Lysobacter silvisoli]